MQVMTAQQDQFPLSQVFRIARGQRDSAQVITVNVEKNGVSGRGEGLPYARYGETPASVLAQIRALPNDIALEGLSQALPPGAARNAVECALWDLQAKQRGCRVWDLLGIAVPQPVISALTISLDTPEAMHQQALKNAHHPVLKIKLGAETDLPCLQAVRKAAPQSDIIIDANEGWSADGYLALLPELQAARVRLIEQPLPAGEDDTLRDLPRPIALCADETCHDRRSLAGLKGKYDMVNIKLDKTGGLQEALALRAAAQKQGFGIMIGCMVSSSLAIAPATLLTQGADMIDLDGSLFLAEDRQNALIYDEKGLHPPQADLWG